MAKMKADVRSYGEAQDYLQGEDSKEIGHNTWVHRTDEFIGIMLQSTYVVRYYPDGKATLHTGGWSTVTTKQRINCFIPHPYCLYQRNWNWYLWDRDTDKTIGFREGMEVPL